MSEVFCSVYGCRKKATRSTSAGSFCESHYDERNKEEERFGFEHFQNEAIRDLNQMMNYCRSQRSKDKLRQVIQDIETTQEKD